jgi:hypothetical protein
VVRVQFTDPIRGAECVLVIPDGGRPGVEHPGADGPCVVLAEISLELDAFYCRLCQWNGRISGAWAADMIRAAR